MKRFSPRYSLRVRLLGLAVGVELVMLALLVGNSLRLLHEAMSDQARWHVHQILPVLGAALKAPLAQRDYATVNAVLQESMVAEGLDYLVVSNRRGEIVAAFGWTGDRPLPAVPAELPRFSLSDQLHYSEATRIEQSGQHLGDLHIGLDLTRIVTARHTLLLQGVAIAAVELLLSTIVLILIGYWLTRHLTALTLASRQVAAGNLSPPPLSEGDDDLGELGAAFNTMSRAVAERVAALTRAKERAEASEQARAASEERLRGAHHHLSLALQSANAGTWTWEYQNNRLTWSDEVFRIFGHEPGAQPASYRLWKASLHPDDLAPHTHRHDEAVRNQQRLGIEYRVVHPSGEVRWVYDLGDTYRDEHGTPLGRAGICFDITGRKGADEELHRTRDLLQSVIENSTDAIYVKDLDGRYLLANPAALAIIGRPAGEILGHTDQELFPPATAAAILAADRRTLAVGSHEYEVRLPSRSGANTLIQAHKRLLRDAGGQPQAIFGVSRDVTALRAAEQALRDSEARFRSMVEDLPILVWLLDHQLRLIYANRAYRNFFALSPREMKGFAWQTFLDPQTLKEIDAEFAASRREERPFHWTGRLRRPDGEERWIESWARPWSGTGSEPPGYIGTTLDISERKLTEELLAKQVVHERILAHSGRLADIGRMVGVIAHQWRQPLSALGMILQRLEILHQRGRLGGDELAEARRSGMEQIMAMSETIDDFRTFYSPDRERVDFPLEEKLRQATAMLEHSFFTAGVRFAVRSLAIGPELQLHGYPNQFVQLLHILLNNARDAVLDSGAHRTAEERPAVTVEAGLDGDRLLITVADNGGGIPVELQPRLFEPFFTTKGKRGTGIGLYMARMIVEEVFAGRIVFASRPGETVFTLNLPVAGRAEPKEQP